ncbi:hypothetical protein GS597_14225 [Synechococcales cyanobacterium C]|uniref:Uncharacterized protein n=1 Tax=Petrachloros mirabilis ULC683 TaxID=2781853 RepID=A0A8K2A8X1_9CYAN|nr:hypothetical protein [Petrachloros mirabilis]NCJ07644.1 hypothetical protein [Petrachloros mirabilis ULC683]
MNILFLDLFIGSCLFLVVWGLLKKKRIIQFPFFMGGIFSTFLIPQAIALVNNPGIASISSINRILFYSSLCAFMCWWGYQHRSNDRLVSYFDLNYDTNKIINAGIALSIFSIICNLILSLITVQLSEFGTWSGPATIILFLSNTGWMGLAILLIKGLERRSAVLLSFSLFTSIPILSSIVYSGRRQATANIFIVIIICIFFAVKKLPSRFLVVLMIVLTIFLIPIFGQMRGQFWEALVSGDINFSVLINSFQSLVLEGSILELRNATLVAEASEITGQYGFGTGFWNDIVFQYIPGQFLGEELKNSLYINLVNYSLDDLFGYIPHTGTTLTAIGDSFQEFWFLGAFIFAIIAYFLKNIWISATQRNSFCSQILYPGLMSSSVIGLTHGIGRFLQEAIFQLILLKIVSQYAMSQQSVEVDNEKSETSCKTRGF